MSDEEVTAIVCEDMETRIERENYDYEDSQDRRCALEQAVASYAGHHNVTDGMVLQSADHFYEWLSTRKKWNQINDLNDGDSAVAPK